MNTHVFKLPTGIECEIKDLSTAHQEILTSRSKTESHVEKLEKVIKDITLRVGSVTNLTPAFIEEMLACDKKKILVEARNFSMDFDPFIFIYEYTDKNNVKKEYKLELPITEESFPVTKVKRFNGSEWEDANYTEYSEVNKDIFTKLPKTGTDVKMTMLDGKGERIAATYTKNSINSSTPVIIRRPVRFELGKDDKQIPIKITVAKLPMKDTEHLRTAIREAEGEVDTVITFDRPDDDATGSSSTIQMDILQTTAFFFPSGAI